MTDGKLTALFETRDRAFLLALRFCGNVADAEDVVQEALLRALKARVVLDAPRVPTWFLTIVANAARNHLTASSRRSEHERQAAMLSTPHTNSPEHAVEAHELRAHLLRELEALESPLREAVSLRYEQGLSYKECAEALSVAEPTLRVQTSRGLQRLREQLSRCFGPVTAPVIVGALGTGFGIMATPALAAKFKSTIAAFSSGGKTAAAAGTKVSLALMLKAGLVGGRAFAGGSICGAAGLAVVNCDFKRAGSGEKKSTGRRGRARLPGCDGETRKSARHEDFGRLPK